MATEQGVSSTADQDVSSNEWVSWIAAVLGLWAVASPFVLSGDFASGTPMYSNVATGVLVALLAGFTGYTIRTSIDEWAGTAVEWASWIAAIGGVWLLVAPFVLGGEIASSTPTYSNVIVGVIVAILGAFVGYEFYAE